ncbi:MAG: Cell-division-associated, ABC-transporter-like signaling protein FtsE [uncultured Cytophagales bacterium]|uniref:Cell-division-associated, ABC-transporter-like signaling protein FtsE n=1 Tax=uncultured Cytophagales bacterium TaxID=158755 RepID=A0A6J4LW17_9SPHI|nr:MAG: Cell-division-associated, ABC-transporter-like signaling protein FtsE [uncultured Cytophagales bacterium]
MDAFSGEPVIRTKDAYILQEQHIVLSKINFSVTKGEFVYLIGRTGSGKSSLLKTLYADLPLRSGEITVAGYPLHQVRSKEIPYLRRKLGIIFQDFQLFFDRSVDENLRFVLKATGWKDSAAMKKRIAEVLLKVGLGTAGSKLPWQLSGGEQQRVVVARALLNEPLVLLADEPTGNLDPEVAQGILQLFLDINRSGTAILMATHNHAFLHQFPARILKCYQGQLLDSQKEKFSLSNT